MIYIQKNGNEFSWNNKRFRFNGINKYNLLIDKLSQSTIQAFFQNCRNAEIRVVRTWAHLELLTRVKYTLGSNLITNPDVESNSNDWYLGAQASWTTEDAQSGTHSLKNASTSGYSRISTPITVGQNKDYVLTFNTKVSNPSGNPPVIFIGTTAGNNDVKDGGYNSSTGGLWLEKQVTFNSGSNTTLYVAFQNWNGNATAYYDNINVSEKTTSELAAREDYLVQLDTIINEASNYGIKLMLSLADNPTYNSKRTWVQRANTIYSSGLSESYPYVGFWDNNDCRTLFKAAMDILLNRVNTINGITNKNNDAIGFIELINEGRYDVFDSEGGTQNTINSTNIGKVTSWINDVGGHFQTEDTNHLLGFGSLAHTWQWVNGDTVSNGSGYGIDYGIQSALDVLDYGDFHTYPTQAGDGSQLMKYGQRLGYSNAISGDGYRAQLRDFVTVMKANGKPVVCGEVGFPREVVCSNTYFPLYPRVNALKEIGEVLWEEGLDGFIPWHGESGEGGSYTINLANTWNGVTTNNNYDDRPIISLFYVWAARFLAAPFPKFRRYGKQV